MRPNTCQMVPTTFQGNHSSDSAMTTSTAEAQPAAGRHGQRQQDAQRDLDQQHRQRKADLALSAPAALSSCNTARTIRVPKTRRSWAR